MAGEMPAGQGPQDDAASSQEGGGIGEIIVTTDKNLAMLAKAAASSGQMPEEIVQGFAQVSEQFRTLVGTAMKAVGGEGGAPKAAPGAGGMAAPEAGGNPNARPMSMGG